MPADLTKKTGVTVLPATIPLPTSDRPLMQLIPDTHYRLSAKGMLEKLLVPDGKGKRKPFRFVGPGFYYFPQETFLVIPDIDPEDPEAPGTWKQRWPEDQLFWVYCWNRAGVSGMFNSILNAPSREF